MKRLNAVVLVGRLTAPRRLEVALSEAATCVFALLVSDHRLYGGHHGVLFVGEHAAEVLDYWELTAGRLEVAVEGWLRSSPGRDGDLPTGIVVVERATYFTADTVHAEVQRRKAQRLADRNRQHAEDA